MSQEIQLSLANQTPSVPLQGSSWGAPVSSALVASSVPQTPMAAFHSHMRGRYGVTAVIAIFFAVLGGAAGFMAFHQGYQSVGLIEIKGVSPGQDGSYIQPLYFQKLNTAVNILHSERVMKAAMASPEWKKKRPGSAEQYIPDWNKNLTIKLIPMSSNITVTYVDEHKDAKDVVPVAVSSLLKAYTDLYGDEQKKDLQRKLDLWSRRQQVLEQKINLNRGVITADLTDIGENPQTVLDERWREHIALEQKVRELDEELRKERGQLQKAQEQASNTPYTVEDLARVDPAMEEMYRIRVQLELVYQEYFTRLGSANPATKAALDRLNAHTTANNKYRDDLRAKYFIMSKPDGNGNFLVSRDLSVKEASVKRMQDVLTGQKQVLDDLARKTQDVSILRTEIQHADEDRIIAKKKIDEFQAELDMAESFRVIDYGGQPQVANDKRVAFGALGFMAGGALPVGLLLLASLMNPRFRFSDEATGQPSAGLTLLGILPDLPDRLSDPEQASIAAHCVHQIRTMLQINPGLGADDRRVFAITSAAPGDGKTSLTLALGLSYAACGTRTLLIDCDLIGAGLTSRMNVASSEGVLEAISNRSLMEYVRTTDIADVSILPVGSGQQLHASTLSPAALRRLIEEARKHFDTILIDTGPVLGSIEASLVAAAADAVVLTVSRGQQRPLVEKTVQHLRAIKANVAGVVFNRAKTDDFDRSISGLSLRSSSSVGNGHNGSGNTRLGPVAKAVQSAFRPAGEEDYDDGSMSIDG